MSKHRSDIKTAEKDTHHASEDPHAMAASCCQKQASSCCESHDAIARRAYDIYIKSGSQLGHCKDNWQKAQTDLNTENQACDATKG